MDRTMELWEQIILFKRRGNK